MVGVQHEEYGLDVVLAHLDLLLQAAKDQDDQVPELLEVELRLVGVLDQGEEVVGVPVAADDALDLPVHLGHLDREDDGHLLVDLPLLFAAEVSPYLLEDVVAQLCLGSLICIA